MAGALHRASASAYYDITHGHGLAIITPVLMDYILNEKSLPVLVNYGVNVWDIEKTKDPYDIAREAISKTQKLYEDMGLTSISASWACLMRRTLTRWLRRRHQRTLSIAGCL